VVYPERERELNSLSLALPGVFHFTDVSSRKGVSAQTTDEQTICRGITKSGKYINANVL
jgi:hypothetical protein